MENKILEEIRLQSERSPEERLGDAYNESVKDYVIDRNAVYPDPEYLIEFGGTPTVPKGNLVAISAKWKNGKTFFCDILTAVFLGSDHFAGCRSLSPSGRVLFYDTEQAESDTARIQKIIDAMTPVERHNDFRVFCLRDAPIDHDDKTGKPSRYEIIASGIEHEHPDLVIVDGIADLIYNYNDVIESQDMVNDLAALASRNNCTIVVVMHQNKGSNDKMMKGHIGTMLYQKCSDVFRVEKHGTLFVATHTETRHRQSQGLVFKLDENAIPMDATADRHLQIEIKRQQDKAELHNQIAMCIEGIAPDSAVRRNIVMSIQERLGYGNKKSYDMFNEAVRLGILKTSDNRFYTLEPLTAPNPAQAAPSQLTVS